MNHCDADESNGRDGQLIGSVEELAARLSRVEARIDELDDGELLIGLASGASSKSEIASAALESEEKVEPAYPDMRAWVSEYFAPMYARPLGGEFRWCRRWWDHAEAISGWRRCGGPGRRCGAIRAWAWPLGTATTSTRSSLSC